MTCQICSICFSLLPAAFIAAMPMRVLPQCTHIALHVRIVTVYVRDIAQTAHLRLARMRNRLPAPASALAPAPSFALLLPLPLSSPLPLRLPLRLPLHLLLPLPSSQGTYAALV